MTGQYLSLAQKTAMVTGGATGLGYAMARALLKAGAHVVLVGRTRDSLDAAVISLSLELGEVDVSREQADLGDRAQVEALANKAISQWGGVDIFVGNAAESIREQLTDITYCSFDAMVQTNFSANVFLTKEFAPQMREKRWGRIIFSSSIAANFAAPYRGNHIYAASKSALNAFCRTIAADLGPFGVTANCLLFGPFETPLLRQAFAEQQHAKGDDGVKALVDGLTSITAVRRLGLVEDVEGIIQLLASDAGSYITGASIPVDGGASIMMRPHEN